MSDKTIDTHTGSTTLGWDFETITATVSLVEDDGGNFYFSGDYKATGTKDLSGPFGPEGPITGNTSGNQSVGYGLSTYYTVSNWTVTDTTVSCNLTIYLQGDGFGPDYLFTNQLYSGNR